MMIRDAAGWEASWYHEHEAGHVGILQPKPLETGDGLPPL